MRFMGTGHILFSAHYGAHPPYLLQQRCQTVQIFFSSANGFGSLAEFSGIWAGSFGVVTWTVM